MGRRAEANRIDVELNSVENVAEFVDQFRNANPDGKSYQTFNSQGFSSFSAVEKLSDDTLGRIASVAMHILAQRGNRDMIDRVHSYSQTVNNENANRALAGEESPVAETV